MKVITTISGNKVVVYKWKSIKIKERYMANTFVDTFRLKASDYDVYDNLKPSCILDLMQDVAGKHADELHCGFKDMVEKNMYWIILRTKFDVIANPKMFSKIDVKTWYKKKGRVDFDREYELVDEDGNVIVRGISKWVAIDSRRRMIVPARNVPFPECDEYEENYPNSVEKLDDFDFENADVYNGKTAFCELDHNRHINNIQYANYVMNALKFDEKEQVISFQIEYVKELELDENFALKYTKIDNEYKVRGYKENGEISFNASLMVK